MVLGPSIQAVFFGNPKFWGSFLNILYFLEPKKLGNPQAMHQTPIGSVKNPPIFWVKGSHFCSPWKKKRLTWIHSLTPPIPNKNAKKRWSHVFTRKKIEPKKKNVFCPKAPPQGIANARGRPTQRRHLGSFKRTDGNPHRLRVLPMVFFWLLVRRSFLEFPTHPPRCMYTIYIFAPTNCCCSIAQ